MARAQFDRLKPEKREVILAAAAAEFAGRGYGAASVNRIIERAGTSKGALYYYFEDKADLLATVVERALARVLEEAHWPALEDLGAADYWARVETLTRASLEQMESDSWYMRLMWAFHRLREEPEARAATAGVLDWSRNLVRAFFERGQELGVVRSDLPMELLLDMYIASDEAGDRWMMEHWSELNEREKRDLLDARVQLVRAMMEPPEPRRE